LQLSLKAASPETFGCTLVVWGMKRADGQTRLSNFELFLLTLRKEHVILAASMLLRPHFVVVSLCHLIPDTLAALSPGIEPCIPMLQDAEWAPEPVLTR
jgi:hypothetical protein